MQHKNIHVSENFIESAVVFISCVATVRARGAHALPTCLVALATCLSALPCLGALATCLGALPACLSCPSHIPLVYMQGLSPFNGVSHTPCTTVRECQLPSNLSSTSDLRLFPWGFPRSSTIVDTYTGNGRHVCMAPDCHTKMHLVQKQLGVHVHMQSLH